MRLKGGKVLIDLSNIDILIQQERVIELDASTAKAILEKGLSVLLYEPLEKTKMCVDLSIDNILDGAINYRSISNDNGDYIGIQLSLTHVEYEISSASLTINVSE